MYVQLAGLDWRRPATTHQTFLMDFEDAERQEPRTRPRVSTIATDCNNLGCRVSPAGLAHTYLVLKESGEGSKQCQTKRVKHTCTSWCGCSSTAQQDRGGTRRTKDIDGPEWYSQSLHAAHDTSRSAHITRWTLVLQSIKCGFGVEAEQGYLYWHATAFH